MPVSRAWLPAALLMACGAPSAPTGTHGPWTARPNDFATHFTIEENGAARRLTVFGPGGRSDTAGVYVLGEGHPLPLPLARLAVVSTTHLPFIAALGCEHTVAGAAHLRRMVDRRWAMRMPPVAEIGTATGVDLETLAMLAPDAVLDHPFGQGAGQAAPHLPTIAITEYLEEHPLGRAEWLRFFGVMLGREDMADSLYAAIARRYQALVVHADSAAPLVFFGSNWQQQWYAPPAGSYMARLIADAGGRYAFADRPGEGNLSLDIEAVVDMARRADHFGQVLAVDGPVDALVLAGGDPRLAVQRAVTQGGFHANSARTDVFGRALLEPEIILQDLRAIFRPGADTAHRPRYFRRTAQ